MGDNLEEMLAELEGETGRTFSDTYTADVDNIDDFLDKIEEEARNSRSRPVSVQQSASANKTPPNRNVPASQPVKAQPQKAQAPSMNSQPQRNPAGARASLSQATTRPGGKTQLDADHGERQLRAQGYEPLLNRGKWYNYSGGKASDFRIKGTTSTRVGLPHAITLRSLDDYGNPARIDNPKDFIGVVLTHRQTGEEINCWTKDNGDCTYDLAFYPERSGTVRMEIKLCGNPMFDIDIQVEDVGQSIWVAKPRLPARPKEAFIIDIETEDGSRPEGVAPFEVQTMGDIEGLKLINNGDGTYKFQCLPQTNGHITIQITLHDQPIKNSPVTVSVGSGKEPLRVKQESSHVETISDDRYRNTGHHAPQQQQQDAYEEPYEEDYGGGEDYYDGNQNYEQAGVRDSTDVSNDDLNRLLDELGS